MSETITTGQKIGFGVVVIVVLGLSICKLFFQNDDQQRKSRTIGKGVIAARERAASR